MYVESESSLLSGHLQNFDKIVHYIDNLSLVEVWHIEFNFGILLEQRVCTHRFKSWCTIANIFFILGIDFTKPDKKHKKYVCYNLQSTIQ